MQVQPNTWFIIVNPAAGNGSAPQTWERLRLTLDATNIDHQYALTKEPGHAIALARAAAEAGGRRFLVIGGDGTANEVLNGLFQSKVPGNELVLGMISSGTGNDWVRTIGAHGVIEDVPRALRACDAVSYDTGLLSFQDNGVEKQRYFLNIAGMGFDGAVAKKLTEGGGWLSKTRFRYWGALIGSLLTYQHTEMEFTIDGVPFSYRTLSVAAGIGKYNGGGMKQLPFADYNDGKLDLTIITTMSKLKMVLSLPRLSSGSFTKMKQVRTFQAKTMEMRSNVPVHVEADGEYLGVLPVRISIIPSGINILRWK
jgi:YegS/Rv2252/BmrU family lipid kinase